MVSRLIVCALLLAAVQARGEPSRQLCLSCHAPHYTGRAACSDCHHGNPASARKNIAHSGLRAGKYVRFTLGDQGEKKERDGLLTQLACRRCHISDGRGNRLAVSLDGAVARKTARELVRSIRQPVAAMPDFGLNDAQITTVVNALFAGSVGRATGDDAPVKVHFRDAGNKSEDVFSKKCGSCHRILTARLGALGTGTTGPDLSGLLSAFYPKSFREGEGWSSRNLELWLINPRRIREWARMQPVELTGRELRELETLLSIVPE